MARHCFYGGATGISTWVFSAELCGEERMFDGEQMDLQKTLVLSFAGRVIARQHRP